MRFEIVQGDELLSSHSGLALVGALLSKTKLRQRLDRVMLPDHPFSEISHGKLVVIDIDACLCPRGRQVSPFDNSNTNKEGVEWTYKNYDGYAPIFAYVGEEGYLVNLEQPVCHGAQAGARGVTTARKERRSSWRERCVMPG